jgi:hypothetical protein
MADGFLAKPKQLELFIFQELCRGRGGRRNNSAWEETIFRFSRRTEETGDGYQKPEQDGGQRRDLILGDSQMRSISFVLAVAFLLVGPSLAGSSDNGLPGVGTFSYNGSPIVTSTPMVVAAN